MGRLKLYKTVFLLRISSSQHDWRCCVKHKKHTYAAHSYARAMRELCVRRYEGRRRRRRRRQAHGAPGTTQWAEGPSIVAPVSRLAGWLVRDPTSRV